VDEEVHTWFNDRARELDASLYGRRMYELMTDYWPTAESDPSATPAMLDFARIWRDLPKIVFSRTLVSVEGNARLVRGDVQEELDKIKSEFAGDLDIGGATLAAEFIRRGLIDEYCLVVHPVILGAGTRYFPALERPIELELIETRRFSSGVVLLRHRAVR
jgi:dihydrofolate reductase